MTVTCDLHSERFFVTKEDTCKLVRHATPRLLVLVLVDFSDLIFAVD